MSFFMSATLTSRDLRVVDLTKTVKLCLLLSEPTQGKPTYPFRPPKDPNTIYFSRNDNTVVLPCKIEDTQASISLHKHEGVRISIFISFYHFNPAKQNDRDYI